MRYPPPKPPAPSASPAQESVHADFGGSVFAILGLVMTAVMLSGKVPSAVAQVGAIGAALSLAVTLFADARHGIRNLVRADVMAILALYFLTLFEFLFPQSAFDSMTDVATARQGVIACLIGFGGLIIGRHILSKPRQHPFPHLFTHEVGNGWMLLIFWGAFIIGYFHMLTAVDFDVVKMVEYFMAPRFSQPWSRAKFGDWKALLYELGMVIYLVPPVAGIIMARRRSYSALALIMVGAGLLFTLFYGFAGGTRNLFASFLLTFLIGYAFAAGLEKKRELLSITTAAAVLLLGSTYLMLQFRTVGFSNYLRHNSDLPIQPTQNALYVDYNLYAICSLITVFPSQYRYLGWEIPYQALIRPIPRALWKSKPEGLSISIEEALGVEGLTIAASFVGEAYMSGGLIAVLLAGLFFGAITSWWDYLAAGRNSQLGILVYASGFFAAVISMRSVFVFSTAILPTITAIILGSWIVNVTMKAAARNSPHARLGPPRPTAKPAPKLYDGPRA